MFDLIGWVGSLLLAFCGLPQAIQSVKSGDSNGINSGFIWAWFIGELMTLIYIIPEFKWPLIFNYTANIIFILIIDRKSVV